MTSPPDSRQQLASLRGLARRVAAMNVASRWLAWVLAVPGACLIVTGVSMLLGAMSEPFPTLPGAGAVVCIAGGAALSRLFWLAGRAVAAAELGDLKLTLRKLPPARRTEALLPLLGESADTREIVEPILRELGHSSEVVPARAPEGTGSEAQPAPSE